MKKVLFIKKINLIFAAFILSTFVVACSNDNNATTSLEKQQKESSTDTQELQQEFIFYEADLSSGNYIAGVDFPKGTYDIEAISGTGNVISSNMLTGGLNAMMGIDDGSGMFEQKYSNINLDESVVLSVSGGVVIHIESDTASNRELVPRNQDITEVQTLGNGNWVSGTNFPAGIYDIEAISGTGNVTSSNMLEGGLNAMMGVDDNSGMFEKSYKNINLPEGTTLSISGCEITLTPSK